MKLTNSTGGHRPTNGGRTEKGFWPDIGAGLRSCGTDGKAGSVRCVAGRTAGQKGGSRNRGRAPARARRPGRRRRDIPASGPPLARGWGTQSPDRRGPGRSATSRRGSAPSREMLSCPAARRIDRAQGPAIGTPDSPGLRASGHPREPGQIDFGKCLD
jgi:hypothetical protein